jgi:hypothetical protein
MAAFGRPGATVAGVGDEPDLARVIATLQALLAQSGALRAVVLIDRGEDAVPVVVDVDAEGDAEVAEGEDAQPWLPDAWVAAEPYDIPPLGLLPPLEVDLAAAEVVAPLGILDAAGHAVRALAGLLPGRSVATVGFATTEPEEPLYLAAREGDAIVASLAGHEYELPADWPS